MRLIIAAVAFAGLVLAIWAGCELLPVATGKTPKDTDFSETRVSTLQAFLLAGGAVITLALAAWRSWTAQTQADTAIRQTDNDEYGRRTDRYTTGVNMLGDAVLTVRMGGLYLLTKLAREDPGRFGQPVCDTIATFIRLPPHDRNGQSVVWVENEDSGEILPAAAYGKRDSERLKYKLRSDVNEAVIELGKLVNELREVLASPLANRPKLSDANLSGLRAERKLLEELDFSKTRLVGAQFDGARLQHSWFYDADLRNTNFLRADLTDASIMPSDATGASFSAANLTSAYLNFERSMPRHLKDACASGAVITVRGQKEEVTKLEQDLWAWRDSPAELNLTEHPTTQHQVRLYDPRLRQAWRAREHTEIGGFGPPNGASPVNQEHLEATRKGTAAHP